MYSLLKIDDLLRPDHSYLSWDDDCFYFMEYFPPIRDDVKSLIMNFKKAMDKRGKYEFRYKGIAINQIATILDESLAPPFGAPNSIMVPMPPSKRKDHQLYDDRMIQLLTRFSEKRANIDVREIISVIENMTASHESDHRPTPAEIKANLAIDDSLCNNEKEYLILVDDVLTTGSHFKACKSLLEEKFPDSKILGLFIARRNPSQNWKRDFEDFF